MHVQNKFRNSNTYREFLLVASKLFPIFTKFGNLLNIPMPMRDLYRVLNVNGEGSIHICNNFVPND